MRDDFFANTCKVCSFEESQDDLREDEQKSFWDINNIQSFMQAGTIMKQHIGKKDYHRNLRL
ncbi:MAG: hypothetical protein J0M05_12380 [Candidatus Kapabacteria bacterium]|nr:hypothetical protein [Candidatus Kapabacteria bacterium]